MKKIVLFIVVILLSCGKKNEKEYTESSDKYHTLKKDSLAESLKSNNKKNGDFKIGELLNDSDLNIAGIYANYGSGKYKFEQEYPDFLIDSTLTEDRRYQSILNLERETIKDENVIRMKDFGVLNINNQGNLLKILLKKEKIDKWKVIDILSIGKAINKDMNQYEMEGNKCLSFTCYNNKKDQYFGVVINKITASGKYEKVLKAFKFDLVKEKIIEVDLKKEKVDCFPEIGDE